MELRRIALRCLFLLGSPDSIAAHVLLGNPDGVDPDSLAHSVSSGRGVPTPCTRRRSPLRSIAQSTRGGIRCADISHPEFRAPTFYIRISHSRMGEEAFQLPRIGMSGSSDSVHPESILGQHFRLPGFCRVSRCSPKASRYLPPTKLDFFSQDILCKFLFSPCNQSKILLGYFLENIFSIYIFEPV